MQDQNRRRLLIAILCFAAVYFIWGSTYAAIRVVVHSQPPMGMAALRFLIAGALYYAFLRWRGAPAPTRREWLSAVVVGNLMMLGGNGIVCWAEQSVPSSVAAMVVATVPIWMVLYGWLAFGDRRPTAAILAGIGCGMAGVVVLVTGNQNSGGELDVHTLILLGAPLCWALGSQLMPRLPHPRTTGMAAAMHMLVGCVGLALASVALGEYARPLPVPSLAVVGSFFYLVVAGSVIALTAYQWLLEHVGTEPASTYAFVNPLVAILLGGLLFAEPLGGRMVVGAAGILVAVATILWSRYREARTAPHRRGGAAATPGGEADLADGVLIEPIAGLEAQRANR